MSRVRRSLSDVGWCVTGERDSLNLCLRGLMVIPTPHADPEVRRPAFRAAHALWDTLRQTHAGMDTLSMGMSDDWRIALQEGATMVRLGTALFGARR